MRPSVQPLNAQVAGWDNILDANFALFTEAPLPLANEVTDAKPAKFSGCLRWEGWGMQVSDGSTWKYLHPLSKLTYMPDLGASGVSNKAIACAGKAISVSENKTITSATSSSGGATLQDLVDAMNLLIADFKAKGWMLDTI